MKFMFMFVIMYRNMLCNMPRGQGNILRYKTLYTVYILKAISLALMYLNPCKIAAGLKPKLTVMF